MKLRTLLLAFAALVVSCDRAPMLTAYSNMPSDYEISIAEKAVVEEALGKFLRMETPVPAEKLKTLKYSAVNVKVCGFVGRDRFFSGYLSGVPGNQQFEITVVADISGGYTPDGIDVQKLCRH